MPTPFFLTSLGLLFINLYLIFLFTKTKRTLDAVVKFTVVFSLALEELRLKLENIENNTEDLEDNQNKVL